MNLQQNIPLSQYTTFKIGGPAEYFVEAATTEEVKEALVWAKSNNKRLLLVGAGSNMLISDDGFLGLALKLNLQKLEFAGDIARVGAGVMLAYLINASLDKNFTGLEFLAGIPGTVGGAVRGNAGTYGLGMSDVVTKIIYLDENLQIKEMSNQEAKFAYRHSIFKENKNIILEVEIKLQKGDIAASRALIDERLKYRQDTQPNLPSAGCVFKNVLFENVDLDKLKSKGIEIAKFEKYAKIPAAYLIDSAGLKGHKIGQAQISEIHANYIVNLGGARAESVVMLISYIKQQIRDKYGIQLQEEVQIVAQA